MAISDRFKALFDLTGKTAVVTGARRGLGQALAVALAKAGANIVGVGQNAMTETEAMVTAEGSGFRQIAADLGRITDFEGLGGEIWAAFGRTDILVNNAGIIRRADLMAFPQKDWDDVLTVNLRSAFFLSQTLAKRMVTDNRAGRIINIASLLSFQGGLRVVSYTASKHALEGMTKAMANELAPHGITVNAIAPGYMATDNTHDLRNDPDRARQLLERIPVGRWGTPDDLATAVIFLAAPASGYVTGSTVCVDGGWMAC
jgi:2-deoxy-D-gluconate 3-dehydrogenase